MVRETDLRRDRFRPGLSIELADEQIWIVPDGVGSPAFGGDYELLLAGLEAADSAEDRARAELALIIFLLDFNYRLTPDDFGLILASPTDSECAALLRARFAEVARIHQSRRSPITQTPAGSRWFWAKFSRFARVCPVK